VKPNSEQGFDGLLPISFEKTAPTGRLRQRGLNPTDKFEFDRDH